MYLWLFKTKTNFDTSKQTAFISDVLRLSKIFEAHKRCVGKESVNFYNLGTLGFPGPLWLMLKFGEVVITKAFLESLRSYIRELPGFARAQFQQIGTRTQKGFGVL